MNSPSQNGGGQVLKRFRKINGKVLILWLFWVLGFFGNTEMLVCLKETAQIWTGYCRRSRMNTTCGVWQGLEASAP